MYYEAIEEILPGCKVYIDTGDGDVQKLLPLENLIASDNSNGNTEEDASND